MAWLANIGSFIANSKLAQFVLAVGAFLLGLKAVQTMARMEGEQKANQKHEREAFKEQARVSETRREIQEENQNAAERAEEAVRTMPRHLPDELREQAPDVADIVLGTRRGGG